MKIKNILLEEHEGAEGFEATLQMPLMFIAFLMLLYFLFLGLAFIMYGNLANTIAQDLNMRQSGYQATASYTTTPKILVHNSTGSDPLAQNSFLDMSKITVTPYTTDLARATNYALAKNQDGFNVPFAGVESINVSTDKAVKQSDGTKMAGNVIKVTINFHCIIYGIDASIPMTVTGYNVIS